jgi:hypothetical protein
MKTRLLFLLCLLSSFANAQYTLTPNDLSFDTLSGTINAYTGDSTDIIIPDVLQINAKNWPVYSIGSGAFQTKGLTRVVLPSRLKEIGTRSFSNNALSSVVIPDSVSLISNNAFEHNDLSSVFLSRALDFIGYEAFANNELDSISFPDSLREIYDRAFAHNKISYLNFNEKLQIIGHLAFYDNRITSLNIPNSIPTIGGGAFNLNRIDSLNGKASEGFIYARKGNGETDSTSIISYGGQSRNVNFIPAQVKVIGDFSFYKDSILSVVIPNGVTTIGRGAFEDNFLSTINLPNSVLKLLNDAFNDNQIVNVSLSNQLNYLGVRCFLSNQISNIQLPNSIVYIGESAFGQNSLTDVTIPTSTEEIGFQAFSSNKLKTVTLGNHLQLIHEYAFAYNDSLNSINLPGNVMKEGHKFLEWKDSDSNVVTIITDFSKTYLAQFELSGFIVSGKIYSGGHQGQSIRLSGEIVKTVDVDPVDGSFSFAVDSGRNIFVSPQHPTISFKPYGISLVNIQSDTNLSFYAQYKVSGRIIGANNVNVALTGDSTDSQVVASDSGMFVFEVNHGQNVIVTPSKTGNSFDPPEYNIGMIQGDREDLDFRAGPAISIAERLSESISIYPNPCDNWLMIKADNLSRIQVWSHTGELVRDVLNEEGEELKLDLSENEAGLYIIRILGSDQSSSYRKIFKH